MHISNDLVGGVGTVINNLCKYFSSSSSLALEDANDIKKLTILDKFLLYLSLKRKLFLKIDTFDILHFHGAWTFHIMLLKTKYAIPTIVSPLGAFHKTSLKKSKIKKTLAKYLYMKGAFQNASCIHAQTLQEAKDIRDYGIKNIPIAIIPNGIDLEENMTINNELKTKLLEIANNRKIILSLSRLHVSKGIDTLIDSFSMLCRLDSNNVLFIVGQGDLKYEAHLKNKIKKLRLSGNIFLLGQMINNDKNTVYDIANLFVLPSYNEGFGLTVLEAYRQKIPVVTTTATPFEQIQSLECGWYVQPTVYDLFLALEEFIKLDKYKLQVMGEKGYLWVKENYSMYTINEKIEALYSWLMHQRDMPDFILKDMTK